MKILAPSSSPEPALAVLTQLSLPARSCSIGALLLICLLWNVPSGAADFAVGSGSVLTIAGSGVRGFSGDGGPATNSALQDPLSVAIGPEGTLYIADYSNYRVRAVAPASGKITTV